VLHIKKVLILLLIFCGKLSIFSTYVYTIDMFVYGLIAVAMNASLRDCWRRGRAMQPITENTLFYGDNLTILETYLPDECIDLIYLDPPFNSNRNYNVLFKEGKVDSTSQIHAFEDTWEWTPATIEWYNRLTQHSPNPQIAILINSLAQFIGHNPMMAYLVNMTARLLPLYRVLKPTGSLYLHCDPTASHYLKIILDVIFGKENFRNEIIWHYSGWNARLNEKFNERHDVILFYAKQERQAFYSFALPWNSVEEYIKVRKQKVFVDESGERYVLSDAGGGRRVKRYLEDALQYGKPVDDVWDIDKLNNSSKEKLGYPTQKPEMLLERIIQASSHEGSWILDPFCGCGTSVTVAQRLNRHWIGIDISIQAIKVISQRLQHHYPGVHFHIDGIPTDYESACSFAAKDKMQFQDWAISLINAHAPGGVTRKGADRGIDGLILFYERPEFTKSTSTLRKILVQVKGGARERRDIATLKGDMERENAPMGVFITLYDPTPEMKREAALAGSYTYSETKVFPRLQILSIHEWFQGKEIHLPSSTVNPFKVAEAKADQQHLFSIDVA
jgi:DNA modification methylase